MKVSGASIRYVISFIIMQIALNAHVQTVFAQTFYNARDLTTNNMFQNALHANWLHYKSNNDYWLNYLAGYVYQYSKSSEFGALFMPVNKECISVRQDGTGDVNAAWFNVAPSNDSDFSGTFCLEPKRIVHAMLNQFHMCLDPYICGLWFEVNFAYEHVHQEMGCKGSEKYNEVKSLTDAGICCGTFKETAINDIELKGGYDFVTQSNDYVGIYIVGTVPTKKHELAVNDCFFKPWVGTNHGSCGFGVKGGHTLMSCEDRTVRLLTDLKYRYVLSADEIRAFDLEKNGPWSRYLLLAKYGDASTSFHDKTLFSQKVSVTPRSVIDWWTGLNSTYGNVSFELGYDLWWRATEQISGLDNTLLPTNVAIFDVAGGVNKTSASTATIKQGVGPVEKAKSDATFRPLSSGALDPQSAEQRSALSQTMYVAASWNSSWASCPFMIGLGGSYEWASKRDDLKTTLNQWSVFVDAIINF